MASSYNDLAGLPEVGFGASTLDIKGKGGYPSFSFNFAAEQAAAYEQLRPFYAKLLEFADGDLDLAKRMLQDSYEKGIREIVGQTEQSRREIALAEPVETEGLQTQQLSRGVYNSGFGSEARKRLSDQQQIRREAVERALEERTGRLESERNFGIEEAENARRKSAFDLEREQRKEASGMAQDKYAIKSTEYQAAWNEAQRAENRRIQKEENKRNLEITKKLNPGIDFSDL